MGSQAHMLWSWRPWNGPQPAHGGHDLYWDAGQGTYALGRGRLRQAQNLFLQFLRD